MAVNKVILGITTLIDISDSTVTAHDMVKGVTAYDKSGKKITGTMNKETWTFTMADGSTLNKEVVVS